MFTTVHKTVKQPSRQTLHHANNTAQYATIQYSQYIDTYINSSLSVSVSLSLSVSQSLGHSPKRGENIQRKFSAQPRPQTAAETHSHTIYLRDYVVTMGTVHWNAVECRMRIYAV